MALVRPLNAGVHGRQEKFPQTYLIDSQMTEFDPEEA